MLQFTGIDGVDMDKMTEGEPVCGDGSVAAAPHVKQKGSQACFTIFIVYFVVLIA
jgi:hypothetical protein